MIYEPENRLFVAKTMSVENAEIFKPLCKIYSKNLANVCYILENEKVATVFSEYISGKSIADMMKQYRIFDEKFVIDIALQVCNGLSVLHKNGFVHRDITPNNIIISVDGVVKIIDFGITRKFDKEKQEDTVVMGTPGYAAPEQFGFLQSDFRVDIYALGALINKMLCGEFPNKQLAVSNLSYIIEKCTKLDVNQRYNNIQELVNDILIAKNGGKVNNNNNNSQSYYYATKKPSQKKQNQKSNDENVLRTRKPHKFSTVLVVIFGMLFIGFAINDIKVSVITSLLDLLSCFFLLFVPYTSFTNAFYIYDWFPLTKKLHYGVRKMIFYVIGIISLGIALFLITHYVPGTTSYYI